MQLLLILALLLYGGKRGTNNVMEQVKPVLETFGGEEIKEALKSAEEISGMLTAVQGLTGGIFGGQQSAQSTSAGFGGNNFGANQSDFFPLAPISAIADKDITYSLSKYIATAN